MLNFQESTPDASKVDSIAFIDQNLAQNESLIQGLDVDKVVVLGMQSPGFDQITQTLEKYQNLDSVHIFSHGSDNSLQLGNASFSQSDIDLYSDDLRRWGDALSSDADILIYGCNVAAGGDQFVQQIAQLTQADVAASDDLTGHASLGGDWDLEVSTGEIESGIAISLEAQAAYVGQLNELEFTTLGEANKLEAENADRSGGASRGSFYGGFSGEGFVGTSRVGAETSFTVNVAEAGVYESTLRYANGPDGPSLDGTKTISIYVNGVDVTQTSLDSTRNWRNWGTQSELLNLQAGVNTIAYRHDEDDTGWVNLDAIWLEQSSEPAPTPDGGGDPVEPPVVEPEPETTPDGEGDPIEPPVVEPEPETTPDGGGDPIEPPVVEPEPETTPDGEGDPVEPPVVEPEPETTPDGGGDPVEPPVVETDDEPSDLPTQPLTFGGSRYELGTAGLTWQQAKAEAEARGGKIVEINSQAENDFILNNFGGENNPIWLGFNDVDTEGTFVDANGDPINYSNWLGAGPNNQNNQDFAAISTTTGQWDDINNIGGAFFENGVWVFDASNQLVIEFPESGSTPTPRPREGVNLIDNGSFEGINVLPRWMTFANDNQVSGWSSLNGDIEAWSSGFGGVSSSDGNVFIELDKHFYGGQDGIYQDVRTEAGRTYLLSFDMRSRSTNNNSETEAVYVQWNGQTLKGNGYRANASREWETINVLVEGTGGLDRLQFSESTELRSSDGSGPFLDNISLKTIGSEFTSSSILHGADGSFGAGIDTRYFQNIDADGNYVYGSTRLVDDNALSYELSDSDVDFLIKQARLGVVSASDLADVSDARGIRELDGFGNNVRNPLWGNADQVYARIVEARYENGVDQPRQGANPRNVSNTILNQNRNGITDLLGPNAGDQDSDLPNNFRGSEFVPAFGQYFDHGLGFLPKGGANDDGTAAGSQSDIGSSDFPLSITRGSVQEGTGINGVAREHPNQTSPYIDQNQAYGSNDAILEFLLDRDDNGQFTGLLFAGPDGGLPNLGELKANWQKGVDAGLAEPIDFDDPSTLRNFRGSGDPLIIDINRGIDIDDHLVAGDGRINENAGLTVVHEIWHNNHNFWVENLYEYFNDNGGVPNGLTSENIFQMAKIINEGEYQRAVFDEFVELLVGSDVHSFRDYNPNVNADLTHEFAAAAFRLGHSMLNNYITVRVDGADNVDFSKSDTVEVPLFDLFLNPTRYRELGAADIMAGMTTSLHQEIDAKLVTTLRNNLIGRPTDLGSFNLARGRDVGLPTLNDMREAVGLRRYSDWSSFGSNLRNSSDLQKFQQVYNSVDDVDLWVGGLAEKVSSSFGFGTELAVNSVMGETFAQVFSVQMIGLQDGDRFYYKHRLFETNLRQNMQSQDFADIVERTLGLEYLQADILKTVDNRFDFRDVDQTQLTLNGTSGHDVIIARNIGETINGGDGDDTFHAKAGNDVVYGEDGDDALHGGAGDDELIGGSGDDRADGDSGNDTILAGDGDDDIAGGDGNDYMDGEADDDELFGGNGNDTLLGSDGNDNVWGGLGNDTVEGGADRDNLSGNEGNDLVDGGSGEDIIIGGAGNDTLRGGSGRDEFWFLPDSGDDVITDFNLSEDRIDLHRYVWEFGSSRINTSTLQANALDSNGGVLLFLPGNSSNRANSIQINGVSRSQLFSNASNTFIFQDRVFERDNLILSRDNIVIDAGSGQPASSFSLEAERLNRTGFTNFETGVTSLRNASSGTLSYTYNGSLGLFDLDVLTFDETDGVSQLEILVNGEVVKTHLLDQNLGSEGYGPSNRVTVTAETLLLKQGDLIQVKAVRNGSEFVRIDKLNFRSLY